MSERVVRGFMCQVDFDHELGAALGGVPVYADEVDACNMRGCIQDCGLYEVEVRIVRVAIPSWRARHAS